MSTTLSIQLTTPRGISEIFTVEGDRIRIGSAAYCEIRLPLGDAAPEQIVLENRGLSGLYAEVVALKPVALLDGAPFSSARLEPKSVLELGGTRISASILAEGGGARARSEQRKPNKLVYAAAIVIAPLALADILFKPAEEELSAPKKAPALFNDARPPCAQSQPERARALASEHIELADAKRERRPFRAYDGVQAVSAYRAAAACYEVAADSARAKASSAAATALERDLDESYRTHRARLDHALSIKDYALARREVRALLDLTSGQTGEYVTWLSSLERRLGLRLGSKR